MLLPLTRCWLVLALELLLWVAVGQAEDSPAEPPLAPDMDVVLPDEATEEETTPEAETEPWPEEVRRSRPKTTQEELEYMARKAGEDPFLQPFAPVGPAPGTQSFYNPLVRLRSGSTLKPQVAKYLIQDRTGAIAGTLLLRIEAAHSAAYGPQLHVTQRADSGRVETIELWQSTISNKAVRVVRRREPEAGSTGPHGVAPAIAESFAVDYLFDRALIRKDSSKVSFARPERMQPYALDVAQLPLLMMLLDCDHPDWPFEAVLFDCTSLATVPLQVTKPARKDVLSAEPTTYACWELPVRFGNDSLLWHVERQGLHRLVKFQFGGYTFTLQHFAAAKA
jgi:hypothetical protein